MLRNLYDTCMALVWMPCTEKRMTCSGDCRQPRQNSPVKSAMQFSMSRRKRCWQNMSTQGSSKGNYTDLSRQRIIHRWFSSWFANTRSEDPMFSGYVFWERMLPACLNLILLHCYSSHPPQLNSDSTVWFPMQSLPGMGWVYGCEPMCGGRFSAKFSGIPVAWEWKYICRAERCCCIIWSVRLVVSCLFSVQAAIPEHYSIEHDITIYLWFHWHSMSIWNGPDPSWFTTFGFGGCVFSEK